MTDGGSSRTDRPSRAGLAGVSVGLAGGPVGLAVAVALVGAGAATGLLPGTLDAQNRRAGGGQYVTPRPTERPGQFDFSDINTYYDGRFTFVRLMFSPLTGGMGFRRRDLKWDHDYPRAERNFSRILDELTTLQPYLEGGNVFAMDDPELFRHPIAYLSEPGFWTMNESEAESLRAYLLKGGFLILDDFADIEQWWNVLQQLELLLPGYRIIELDVTHPIFDAFFHIESLDIRHPVWPRYQASFYGMFVDNDPMARPLVIINRDNDIGDYWEWSDAGWIPIEISNEAYKLGVNYIVYAMTH